MNIWIEDRYLTSYNNKRMLLLLIQNRRLNLNCSQGASSSQKAHIALAFS